MTTTADRIAEDLRQKQVDTLKAELALKGIELYELPGGDFVVRRWGLVKAISGVRDLVDFARQVAR